MEKKEEAASCGCGFEDEEAEKWRREALSMKTMNEEEMRKAVDKISSDDERMTKLLALLFDRIARDEMRLLAG